MKFDIHPGVKGLIFDLDGTLVDSMPYHFNGWKMACEKYGVSMDQSFFRFHAGSSGWSIAAAVLEQNSLNGSVSVEDLINAKLEEFHKVQHLIKPIEPVVDIVRKYHGILPMAVGTGGHREAVEKTLEITGLKQYFDVIVTSNDVENYKPHPETFLKCAEKLKVAPRFIEVFEDGEMGIKAARDAGMIATDVRLWYKSDW
jgi:beta-phosphoglucomutase family hydrolase